MIGRSLAQFRITALLGEGGMGQVYQAEDSKLGRDVAIKVLPEGFVADTDRVARFEREARVLASLNHPNIAAIHEIGEEEGVHFLVMELAPGETLAERIDRGPLPVGEALKYGREIAKALEAAHAEGIIHRDLKPLNVKITPGGGVKLLDFGLAKIFSPDSDVGSAATSAAADLTATGMILGTAAYMSPEQVGGDTIDGRTDIWALGCVLYEMLTGRKAFGGETGSEALAAILGAEPEWSALPPETPVSVRTLLRRCLQKDTDRRLHHVADARIELEEAMAEITDSGVQSEPSAPVVALRSRTPVFAAIAAAVALLVGLLLGSTFWRPGPGAEPRSVRAFVPPPAGGSFVLHPERPGSVAVSPDGSQLVYTAQVGDDPAQLWIRRLDEAEAHPLPGTEDATYPFWSPDSRYIAFFAEGKLKKIEATGGPPLSLTDAGMGRGGSWNADGVILFAPDDGAPILSISEAGGDSVPVTEIDAESGDRDHREPRFLPDGERFLFVARRRGGSYKAGHRLMLGSLSGDAPRELIQTFTQAEVAGDHLWYVREETLLARPIDRDTAELTGTPVPVAAGAISSVWPISYALGYFSVSPAGVIAFHQGGADPKSILTWYDRNGRQLSTVGEVEYQYHPNISPDGSSAALQLEDPDLATWNLWVYDLERGIKSRFTSHPSVSAVPVFSPDGERIVFVSMRSGDLVLYVKPVVGGEAEPLLEGGLADYGRADLAHVWPMEWSPDGRHVVYFSEDADGNSDLWALPLLTKTEPIPLQQTPFNEVDAAISPDGRWLAYTSDESERYEIYITAFPDGGRRWQISSGGGTRPEWNPRGNELFFLDPDDVLMSATMSMEGDSMIIDGLQPLFPIEVRYYLPNEPGGYAVGPDGERFLVNRVVESGTTAPLALIVGWPEELESRQR